MTKFLIDSDILMDFFKKKREVVSLIIELTRKGELTASIISVTELRSGWNKDEADFFLPQFYQLIKIKEITLEIAILAGKLRQEYKGRGKILPSIDTLIAATAIVSDCQLVTRNKRDYPIKELELYPL